MRHTPKRHSNFKKKLFTAPQRLTAWAWSVVISAVILAILFFIVFNFYIFSSIVNINSFFYTFLLLSLLTDGLFIFIHLPRRGSKQGKEYFNPDRLTIVIACYNGEEVIAQTIKDAAVHVPLDQIIVVSDASTDRTAEIARNAGVRVIENATNLHKVESINVAMKEVKTPYVLILDDDTLIGKTFIPTSLLDEGYTAVAFNVMPVAEKGLLNELQRFEYRSTMQMGKNLRAGTGAIGNISGAIGLYRTKDLIKQIHLHSGQFAGEDEQRTILALMYGEGKGITYTDSLVLTHAPATYKDLFKQRALSWSLAVPELLVFYIHILLSSRYHYLLKAEKAYQTYNYLTDPLRLLFLWTLILKPEHLVYTYGFYLLLNLVIWLKLGRQEPFRVVVFGPLYTLALIICRFIGYFYWFSVKLKYLRGRHHRKVNERHLLAEYSFIGLIVFLSWFISLNHFREDMNLLSKINTAKLTDNAQSFNYDSLAATLVPGMNAQVGEDELAVVIEPGDTSRAVAHKAIDKFLLESSGFTIPESERWRVDLALADKLSNSITPGSSTILNVSKTLISDVVTDTLKQNTNGA